MKRWATISELIGIGCSSLCFLGLPALLAWGTSFGRADGLPHGWMLLIWGMSFLMLGLGAVASYRRHRKKGPGSLMIVGTVLLAATDWTSFPRWLGWVGLAGLLAAWIWDWRLLHRSSCASGHVLSLDGSCHAQTASTKVSES